jgi:hypothetical protein
MAVAAGSVRLKVASISRDQTKVEGEASALTCERREPGTTSVSDSPEGTRETSASRNPLTPG